MELENTLNRIRSLATYKELTERTRRGKEAERIYAVLALGDKRYEKAFGFLRGFIGTEYNHQALTAMSSIDYFSTLDIVVSLLKNKNFSESKSLNLDSTLSSIFTDKIDKSGQDKFLEELKYCQRLDKGIKEKFYSALTESARFSDIKDEEREDFLSKAKRTLRV